MNQKGQVVITVMVMIIAAIVGLIVLNSITSTFCTECSEQTAIAKNLTTVAWVNDTCVGTKCSDEPWSVTCNSTELEAGTEYSIDDCNVLLTNATWNNTICYLNYEASGTGTTTNYDSGILGVIVCLLPVLAALGIMVLAITWAVLK